MNTATGFNGVELHIGDRVVYPGRAGSNMWVNEGEIIDIVEQQRWYHRTPVKSLRILRLGDNRDYHWRTVNDPKPKVVSVINTRNVVKVTN